MVLTTRQAEQYLSGKLPKGIFIKLLPTIDFENYLYRYCRIDSDIRDEINNTRYTTFIHYGIKIVVTMQNGILENITYTY